LHRRAAQQQAALGIEGTVPFNPGGLRGRPQAQKIHHPVQPLPARDGKALPRQDPNFI